MAVGSMFGLWISSENVQKIGNFDDDDIKQKDITLKKVIRSLTFQAFNIILLR